MVTPVRNRISPLLLIAVMITCGCGGADKGILEGERLTIEPCGDEARVFEPFLCEFDFLTWVQSVDETGLVEMRRGHRQVTESDLLVLQFTALPETQAAWAAAPDQPLPIDDHLIRVSVLLNQRCPKQVQPLVVTSGDLYMDRFDTDTGGRITGWADFDLVDGRAPNDPPVAGKSMRLTFDIEVRHGKPHDIFTRY